MAVPFDVARAGVYPHTRGRSLRVGMCLVATVRPFERVVTW